MKKRSYIFIPGILPVLFLFCTACVQAESRALVKWVIDGDTIVLANGKKVRYQGINCPEIAHDNQPGEPFGKKALKRNIELVKGKVVRLVYGSKRHDRFGRILAYIFLPGGRFVNEVLVREGLAHVCFSNKDLALNKRLLAAQKKAIRNRRGIWSIEPARPEPYYIGNRHSLRFHRPDCPFGKKIRRSNKVIFKTRLDAAYEGYCPCKKCRP